MKFYFYKIWKIIPVSTPDTTAVAFPTKHVEYPYLRRNNDILQSPK